MVIVLLIRNLTASVGSSVIMFPWYGKSQEHNKSTFEKNAFLCTTAVFNFYLAQVGNLAINLRSMWAEKFETNSLQSVTCGHIAAGLSQISEN